MFSVLFEVHPRSDQWDTYLAYARMLRPELEQIDGFVDNVRYRSLTREGWILSLSGWRDEKAVVRWRTRASHHEVQAKGRAEVLLDYHLRVGQLTDDTRVPAGHVLAEQRLDETDIGYAKTVTLLDGARHPEWVEAASPEDVAAWLGVSPGAPGLVAWDVFEAVLTPGDVIALCSWRDDAASRVSTPVPAAGRFRRVRVIRDYAMRDRREAPQYYPDVTEPAAADSPR